MRPAVIRDLVTFARFTGHKLRIFCRILANQEKGGLDVMLGEQIEEFRCQFRAWSIIECHRDVRAVDVHPIKSDAGISGFGRGRFFLFACWGVVGCAECEQRQRAANDKNERTSDKHEF